MTKLCFIGDSHLACIKKAWEVEPRDIAATFFALPGRAMQYIEPREGALRSEHAEVTDFIKFTSGGIGQIDSSHDVYVLHAMQLGVIKTLELCSAAWGDGQSPSDRVADPAFREAVQASIRDTIATQLLGKLRSISPARVIVSPTPMAEKVFPKLRARLAKTQAASALARLFNDECEAFYRTWDAQFLAQPPGTLAEDGLATAPQYALEPARFRPIPGPHDGMHMNTQYGAAVVADLLKALG